MSDKSGERLGNYVKKLRSSEGSVECGVCGAGLAAQMVFCPSCDTPYHSECWDYNDGCAVYGCTAAPGRRGEAVAPVRVRPAPARPAGVPLPKALGLAFASLLLGISIAPMFGPGNEMGLERQAAAPRPPRTGRQHRGDHDSQPPKDEWIRRIEYLEGMGDRHDSSYLRPLLESLKQPERMLGAVHVRTKAAEMLARGHYNEAIPDLIDALNREETFFARPVYAASLYKLGDPVGLSKLGEMLEAYTPEMDKLSPTASTTMLTAMSAAGIVAELKLTQFGPKLVSFLHDSDASNVSQALSFLTKMRYAPAIPEIAKLLDRGNCAQVWEASQALGDLEAEAERAHIQRALEKCPAYASGLPKVLRRLDAAVGLGEGAPLIPAAPEQ